MRWKSTNKIQSDGLLEQRREVRSKPRRSPPVSEWEGVAFLLQNCNVPLWHIVAPGAMGEADPVAPNETAEGRAENRRVEVKVLVNSRIGWRQLDNSFAVKPQFAIHCLCGFADGPLH
jgi:hypothetical protein